MAKTIQYHFVLSKEDEKSGLKDHLDSLAAGKQLTAKIKTALTLLAELENGNTQLLDSLFPEVRCIEPPEPPPAPPSKDEMQIMIENAVRTSVAEEIKKLPAGRPEPAYKQSGQGIGAASRTVIDVVDETKPPPKPSGMKKVIDIPIIEDDPDDGATIVLTKKIGTMNGSTLIAGVLGLD